MSRHMGWIAALLVFARIWAQEGTLKVGAVLHPQNTWLFNQDDSDAGPILDYEVTWGFAGGLTVSYNFTDYLGAGLDILYSSQGQKYKGTENNTQLTAQTRLNYLKLPILFRFNSDPNSPVQFNFFIGPQLNFLLSYTDKAEWKSGVSTIAGEAKGKEFEYTIQLGGVTTSEKGKLTDLAYSSFLFGAAVGLGVGFKLTDEVSLTLHFRGDYAFGDAENKDCKIDHSSHGGGTENFWETKPKYGGSVIPAGYKRPLTTAVTGGFMLGVTYNLPLQ
ncbi:MAG: porin family protein [Bacteroidia bacterium]|nr:PorT family protein [Bacteroidia bacterium]MDW8134025.1 porin family protein [Bacteroidia bacterium]